MKCAVTSLDKSRAEVDSTVQNRYTEIRHRIGVNPRKKGGAQ